jgi:hypothetical protein
MKKRQFIATVIFPGLLTGLVMAYAFWARWSAASTGEPAGTPSLVTTPTGIVEYERLRLGMTPAEVEAAVGMPPGYYDTTRPPMPMSMSPIGKVVRYTGLPENNLPDAAGRPSPNYPAKITLQMWTWSEYWIWVAFDKENKVVGIYLLTITFDPFRGRR